ncbi:hypothetical protein F3Y22_tig00112159pilonHSYRG00167 [Hibiscus syriacus]|uniref:Uncharacterized protein n=1 Tax=Hibiscus syriacus TaxID=106335 RepID=A0A6A2YDL0_HIBSY|nr:hypothetical protein F3Y22_tig00112159pilonHSYRG00167 [Hibiscus syriacus]
MVRSRPTPTDTTAWQQFEDDEAKVRFQNFKNRKLFFELGFIFTVETDGGFGPDVMDIVTPLKWKKFTHHPGCWDNHAKFEERLIATHTMGSWRTFVLKTLSGMDVKRVDTRSTENVFSRAPSYGITSLSINSCRLLTTRYHLCFENTEWNGRQTSRYSVNRECLQPRAKLWNHFLKHKLMPTSHNTTVSLSRLLRALVFPNLITALCRKKKVEENAFDEILPGLSGITRARLPLLLGLENPKSKKSIHKQSAGTTQSIAEAMLLALEEAVIQTQTHLHALHGDIRNFFGYVKHRDVKVESMFQEIIPHVQRNFPGFPNEILPAFNVEASPEPEQDAANPPADDPSLTPHRSETPEYPVTVPVEETPNPVPAPKPSPAPRRGKCIKTTAGRSNIVHYYSTSSESSPAPIHKRTRRGAVSTSKATLHTH